MVANAGILTIDSILDSAWYFSGRVATLTSAVSVESFDRLVSINVRGTLLCYKYAAKQMVEQGKGGRIIGAILSCMKSSSLMFISQNRRVLCGRQTRYTDRQHHRTSTIDLTWLLSRFCHPCWLHGEQVCHPRFDAERRCILETGPNSFPTGPLIRFFGLAALLTKHGITVNAYAPGIVQTDMGTCPCFL